MNFNTRQQKVLNATEPKILCLACAAAGKTRVLTERVKLLVTERNVKPEDIVAITFTNMAANEMKRRLGNISNNMFIGTIHSYGNQICQMNGVDTHKDLATRNFDNILEKAIRIPVNQYPHIGHLLIDECQDLSPLEFQFLNRLYTDNIFFCGDNRQAIYQFRGCTDKYLRDMWRDTSFTKYYLTDNYRNAPNIIDFADDFLKSSMQLSPSTVARKQKDGLILNCSFNEAVEELSWSGDWGSWFVLTRNNNELAEAQEILDSKDIPNVTFKKGDLESLTELDEIMNSNRVKVLTIHSAKGLENKNVIVVGAKTYCEEERKIAYVAATRAENSLYWCHSIAPRKNGKYVKPGRASTTALFETSNKEIISF